MKLFPAYEALMSFEGLVYGTDILDCKFYQSRNHNLATPHIVIIPLIEFTAFFSLKATTSFNVIYIPYINVNTQWLPRCKLHALQKSHPWVQQPSPIQCYSPSTWEKSWPI